MRLRRRGKKNKHLASMEEEESEKRTVRIFVGGLGEAVTTDDIRKLFESLGIVQSLETIRTKGRSLAYLDFIADSKSLSKLFSKVLIFLTSLNHFLHVLNYSIQFLVYLLIRQLRLIESVRATRCSIAPAYAGSGKGSHHLVYCKQPYLVFYTRSCFQDLTQVTARLIESVQKIKVFI